MRLARNVLIGLFAFPAAASAELITVDFNAAGQGINLYDPYLEDGFRVSSVVRSSLVESGRFLQNHYDLDCAFNGQPCGTLYDFIPEYDGTPWLGTDNAGSCRLLDDPGGNFVGEGSGCVPTVRIDRFGALFTPLDLLSMRGAWLLSSSKAGVIEQSFGFGGIVSFAGDAWRDIQWMELTVLGSPVGAPVGFDNLRILVPEPGTLSLLGAGLFAVAVCRRRKNST